MFEFLTYGGILSSSIWCTKQSGVVDPINSTWNQERERGREGGERLRRDASSGQKKVITIFNFPFPSWVYWNFSVVILSLFFPSSFLFFFLSSLSLLFFPLEWWWLINWLSLFHHFLERFISFRHCCLFSPLFSSLLSLSLLSLSLFLLSIADYCTGSSVGKINYLPPNLDRLLSQHHLVHLLVISIPLFLSPLIFIYFTQPTHGWIGHQVGERERKEESKLSLGRKRRRKRRRRMRGGGKLVNFVLLIFSPFHLLIFLSLLSLFFILSLFPSFSLFLFSILSFSFDTKQDKGWEEP